MASRFTSRLAPTLHRSLSTFLIHYRTPLTVLDSPFPTNLSVLIDPPCLNLGLRFLATLRRQPVNSRTIDIGARARQLQNRRLWSYALTFSCVAGFIILTLNNFQDNLVFYVTPTDAMEKFLADPSKNKFRLGGLVLEGSVVQPASSPEMEFVVTDLITDILVKYEGSLPDLFREGHSVVVEGFIRPFKDKNTQLFSSGKVVSEKARSGNCYFAAIEVLAKHDEKYMPPEVAAAIERNKALLARSQETNQAN